MNPNFSIRVLAATEPTAILTQENVGTITELIAYIARVSNPGNRQNVETSSRLIQYLINHKHWSPLEMCNVVIEISTSRDIARQMLRHRSFNFQEFSQRYAVTETQPIFREARLQDIKNRQNSLQTDDVDLKTKWLAMQEEVYATTQKAYTWALENGIAKEVARTVLPEGMTRTTIVINGNIRSWYHYILSRIGEDSQLEHREIAQELARVLTPICELRFC
jgi:thymidylate synthase (FAD)